MAVLYPCTTCEHNSNGCCTQFKGCGKYRRWLKTKCQRSADEMTAEIKEKEEASAKERKYHEHIQWMLDNLVSANW